MTEETKSKTKEEEKTGKEFIIPLRRKFKKTAAYRRTPKAIRTIKEFLVRHMKYYERDLKKVRLDKYLNELIWTRGIKNPPAKIKVRAFFDGDFIRAELVELPERLKFKKERLERRESRTVPVKEKAPEVPLEAEKAEEAKEEEKEKKAAVVEAGLKMEKVAAKQAKHKTKMAKQPKAQPRRMALQK